MQSPAPMRSPASVQPPPSASTPARRSRFRLKPWAIAITAAGMAGAAVVIAQFLPLGSSLESNLASETAGNTVVVQYGTLPIQIRANGSVQPVRTINLSPKEDGRIVELLVREGDRITAGQLIARMDDQQIQAQVAQYRAALARSQAELAERLAGNRPEDIAKAEAEVARSEAQWQSARSQLELATARLTRRQFLAAQGAISQESLDEAQTEVRNAQDNLAQLEAAIAVARQELARQQNGFRAEEIAQAQAQVAEAAAQLQFFQIQLENTLVRSPFSGIITRRFTDVGDFVAPTTSASSSDGATSASIAELSSGLEVEAKVPEASIAQIRLEQAVEIRSDSYPDQVFNGEVSLIAERAVEEDNITSFRVKVTLQTGAELLKSGMNVKLTFMGQPIRNALVAPLAAIVTQTNGQKGVWLVDAAGKPRFQVVQLGAESGDRAQILAGLQAGDRILLSPPAEQIIPGVDNTEGSGL